MHATAQGVVAGANLVLVDFHPAPAKALVDGPQAMLLSELSWFLDDVAAARVCYEKTPSLGRTVRFMMVSSGHLYHLL
jgi:3-deoxy-7-phosphoheptulonate synthase